MTSKLHIDHFGKPLCGRQLSNIRQDRAQVSTNAVFAQDAQAFMTGLDKGKSCRHCAREVGLLPKLVRVTRDEESEDE